jgi:regulator of protease activity HflC (stomatin/prohibitin superfamily)
MILVISFIIVLVVLAAIGVAVFRHNKTRIVPEDYVAVTIDRHGFVKRILPAGRHVLRPFEEVEFCVAIQSKLTGDKATALTTGDGLLVNANWSGVYHVAPNLITGQASQRLRGLPNADRTVARHVDIFLRKLVGHYPVQELFKPTVRDRIERQLSQLVAGKVKGLGIVLSSFNLGTIEIPAEVAEALNKAKAIEALDHAIRQVDPATREVIRGVYQLDEMLHWDRYLPTPSRLTMKRREAVVK